MDAIYLLIPIALVLVVIGIAIFFWAVKSDQFEDLEGPAHSILFDDDKKVPARTTKKSAEPEVPQDRSDDAKKNTEES